MAPADTSVLSTMLSPASPKPFMAVPALPALSAAGVKLTSTRKVLVAVSCSLILIIAAGGFWVTGSGSTTSGPNVTVGVFVA